MPIPSQRSAQGFVERRIAQAELAHGLAAIEKRALRAGLVLHDRDQRQFPGDSREPLGQNGGGVHHGARQEGRQPAASQLDDLAEKILVADVALGEDEALAGFGLPAGQDVGAGNIRRIDDGEGGVPGRRQLAIEQGDDRTAERLVIARAEDVGGIEEDEVEPLGDVGLGQLFGLVLGAVVNIRQRAGAAGLSDHLIARQAENGARAGVQHLAHTGGQGGIEHVAGALVCRIQHQLRVGRPRFELGGSMIKGRDALHAGSQRISVEHVAVDDLDLGMLQVIAQFAAASGEDTHRLPICEKLFDNVTTDEPSAAGNEVSHRKPAVIVIADASSNALVRLIFEVFCRMNTLMSTLKHLEEK